MKNRVYNFYLDNLVEGKNSETRNILINDKNDKYLVIYFTRDVHSKSIKILSLCYHELMGKILIHEEKNI